MRRTVQRRAVSDREAMKQLVDCVGMSARKKVLESGRKPRVLLSAGRSSTLKELRFDRSVAVVGDAGVSFRTEQASQSHSDSILGASLLSVSSRASVVPAGANATRQGSATGLTQEIIIEDLSSDLDSDVPPSPSPTPRPGSAMSILSRRSQTPTGSYVLGSAQGKLRPRDGAFPTSNSRRSVSPSPTETKKAGESTFEDKSSSRLIRDGEFSSEALEHMERRYKRLMGDIAIVEGRLDEVAELLR